VFISQKAAIFIATAVKTSDLTWTECVWEQGAEENIWTDEG
jgi:hypothetical protein